MTDAELTAGRLPAPPEHLTEPAAAFWRDVVTEYELDAHNLKRLEAACDSYDRMCAARRAVLEAGMVFEDRFGQVKPSPAIAIERDARLALLRALRELGLDIPVPEGRPPRRGGQRW